MSIDAILTVLEGEQDCQLEREGAGGGDEGAGSPAGEGGGGEGQCYTHWQVRVLKCIDYFLEEAAKDRSAALTISEVNVCILPCHPAGLGPQVAVGAIKAGHHIVQQQPLQLIFVRSLQAQAERYLFSLSPGLLFKCTGHV